MIGKSFLALVVQAVVLVIDPALDTLNDDTFVGNNLQVDLFDTFFASVVSGDAEIADIADKFAAGTVAAVVVAVAVAAS